MIILVGVVITLAFQEGLFTRAKTASTKTQVHADREELYASVVSAMNPNTGIVSFSTLVNDLGDAWAHTGNSFPSVFTKKSTGNSFIVYENGTLNYTENENISGGSNIPVENNTPENYLKEEDLELGTGVSLIPYEDLTGNIKQAVDDGKVVAVLTENINETATIAVIPTGFTVSSTEGENTISGGLVVRDGSNNEFVWIPVPTLSSMAVLQEEGSNNYRGVLYNWEEDSTGATPYSWSANSTSYREPAVLTATKNISGQTVAYDSQEAFTKYVGKTYSSTMYQEEFDNMAKRVGIYKGFYVGRYETGGFNSSTIVVKAGERGTYNSHDTKNSINFVTWYKAYQMQKDFASENTSIASSMIWGCQWDQVMKFVDNKEDGEGNIYDVTTGETVRQEDLRETGSIIQDKVQNIFDLEGNVCEWTLEAYTTEYRMMRGGDYSCNGDSYSAERAENNTYDCYPGNR